jgi:hypothetical protein
MLCNLRLRSIEKSSQKSSIIFEIQRQENSLHKKKHGECFSQFEWNNGHAFIQDKIEILAPIKILLDSLEDENKKANNQSYATCNKVHLG